jgi:hypothetical protein
VAKRSGRGGARKGAGRKPAVDPKMPITIYVEESIINKASGIEEIKKECTTFLRKKFQ